MTSSFSVNAPQSSLFSEKLVSFSPYISRLEEIEIELENIFAVEKYLSYVKRLQVYNMQLQIDKIKAKYSTDDSIMIPLDEMRILRFQERIDALYAENEPTRHDFIRAEALMAEKEALLDL